MSATPSRTSSRADAKLEAKTVRSDRLALPPQRPLPDACAYRSARTPAAGGCQRRPRAPVPGRTRSSRRKRSDLTVLLCRHSDRYLMLAHIDRRERLLLVDVSDALAHQFQGGREARGENGQI